jgi:hypothetical protein
MLDKQREDEGFNARGRPLLVVALSVAVSS